MGFTSNNHCLAVTNKCEFVWFYRVEGRGLIGDGCKREKPLLPLTVYSLNCVCFLTVFSVWPCKTGGGDKNARKVILT